MQTHEEAMVYVKELGIFLTMKVLENTPAVLSLGKLGDENGYSYEWINGQRPHLILDGIPIRCNTENFVLIVVPGLSASSPVLISELQGHFLHLLQARLRHQQQHQVIMRLENERMELKVISLQCLCSQPNTKNQIKRNPRLNEMTRCVLKSRSGCKNSEKIWWMMKFLNEETLTPVLLMKHL